MQHKFWHFVALLWCWNDWWSYNLRSQIALLMVKVLDQLWNTLKSLYNFRTHTLNENIILVLTLNPSVIIYKYCSVATTKPRTLPFESLFGKKLCFVFAFEPLLPCRPVLVMLYHVNMVVFTSCLWYFSCIFKRIFLQHSDPDVAH